MRSFMVLFLLVREVGGVGQFVVTGQLPFSPALFWLLAELAELCPTEARPPAGQGAEIFVRKSATKERRRRIPHRGPRRNGGAGRAGAGTYNPSGQQPKKASQTRQGQGVRSPA